MDNNTSRYYGVKGWLLIFSLILIITQPYQIIVTILDIANNIAYDEIWNVPKAIYNLYMFSIISLIVLLIMSISAGILIIRKKPYAIRFTLIFLGLNLLVELIIIFALEFVMQAYYEDYTSYEIIMTIIKPIGFTIIWGSYLINSKRVKATFHSENTDSKSEKKDTNHEEEKFNSEEGSKEEWNHYDRDMSYDEKKDFYASILELEGIKNRKDIRSKYLEMIKKYHPDKVSHLGDEFKEIAEQKAKMINQANEFFTNHNSTEFVFKDKTNNKYWDKKTRGEGNNKQQSNDDKSKKEQRSKGDNQKKETNNQTNFAKDESVYKKKSKNNVLYALIVITGIVAIILIYWQKNKRTDHVIDAKPEASKIEELPQSNYNIRINLEKAINLPDRISATFVLPASQTVIIGNTSGEIKKHYLDLNVMDAESSIGKGITCISYNNSKSLVLCGTTDGHIVTIEDDNMEVVNKKRYHNSLITAIKMSDEYDVLAVTDIENNLYLETRNTSKYIKDETIYNSMANCIEVINSEKIILGNSNGGIIEYDIKNSKFETLLNGDNTEIKKIKYLKSMSLLIILKGESEIEIFTINNNELEEVLSKDLGFDALDINVDKNDNIIIIGKNKYLNICITKQI
jgi:hypothetical protein